MYVRQSTADQLVNNPESRRRQYALAARARTLGWSNVVVIDDDLGRSGGGTARPGFDRLLAAICTRAAGAVFAIEASRLARNGRGPHTLPEFCALVHCLIIDEDGVYDPKRINDRLLVACDERDGVACIYPSRPDQREQHFTLVDPVFENFWKLAPSGIELTSMNTCRLQLPCRMRYRSDHATAKREQHFTLIDPVFENLRKLAPSGIELTSMNTWSLGIALQNAV